MKEKTAALVEHFKAIERKHMRGLPIVNPRLYVDAVGFTPCAEHCLGVLITPWFMNLVLLPGNDAWSDCEPGSTIGHELPAGRYEFNVSHDAEFGTYLTAVLYQTVVDFPDQETARAVAADVLRRLLFPDGKRQGATGTPGATLSRRDLFRRLGGT